MTKPPTDFFTKEMAAGYDERNSKLSSITENLHFLIRLTLEDLPARAKVLSVGAGTGAEILSLAKAYPSWSFVAIEPSLAMLDICRERMQAAGFSDRCEFFHGYVQDFPEKPEFDAVVSVLVAHFINREERLGFFQNLSSRLRPDGYLVNAEIGFDLESAELPMMLKNWGAMQRLTGATPESLAKLPQQLKEVLTVLPPAETESLFRKAGIAVPIRFFQSLMITAWYGVKSSPPQ